MTWLDLVIFSIANLTRNKLRTILTIAGVVIGIAAIVFLVSLGFGVQNVVMTQIGSLKDLTQVKVEPNSKVKTALLDDKAVSEFKKYNNVRFVSPSYYTSSQIVFKKTRLDLTLYAMDPKYMSEVDINADAGKKIDPSAGNEVIISLAALKKLDLTQIKEIIGKSVALKIFKKDKTGNISMKVTDADQIQSVKIVGVAKNTKEEAIYIPIKNLESLKFPYYDQILIKTKDTGEPITAIKEKLTKKGYKVSVTADILTQVKTYFGYAQIALAFFGMIALFVSSIGIFNTMTISLLERTHEIGVMKAIGATNKDVRRMFMLEAAQIGFWGGILGLVFGWLGGFFINFAIGYFAIKFKGEAFDLFDIPVLFAVIAVSVALAVSLLAGVYPARRAGKLNPLEAIRYE